MRPQNASGKVTKDHKRTDFFLRLKYLLLLPARPARLHPARPVAAVGRPAAVAGAGRHRPARGRCPPLQGNGRDSFSGLRDL